jgi:hypothetical protein
MSPSSHQRDKTSSFRVHLLPFTPVLIELSAVKYSSIWQSKINQSEAGTGKIYKQFIETRIRPALSGIET